MNKNCKNVMYVIVEIICFLNVCSILLVIYCDVILNIDICFF